MRVLPDTPGADADAGISVVENVNMKAYAQATRHLVYTLFDSLIATHRNGELCLSIEDTFVVRVLSADSDQLSRKWVPNF